MPDLSFNLNSSIVYYGKEKFSILPNQKKEGNGLYRISLCDLFYEAEHLSKAWLSIINPKSGFVPLTGANTATTIAKVISVWLRGKIPVLLPENLTSNERKAYLSVLKTAESDTKIRSIKPKIIKAEKRVRIRFASSAKALVIFTSGSTGTPKAVVHTFGSLFSAAQLQNTFLETDKNSIWLQSLPLYHIGGFMILFRTLQAGCSLILSKQSGVPVISGILEKENPTHISLVPTQLTAFSQKPELLLSCKKIILGGAEVRNSHYEIIRSHKLPVIPIYGSTETAAFIASGKIVKSKNSFAIAYSPLKGVDFQLQKIPGGNNQESLLIHSPTLAYKIYGGNSVEFMDINKKKYYTTSDAAKFRKDGSIELRGRTDAIIISGGKNISLSEVESAIKSHAKVSDCSILALKNEYWGEMLCALVETGSGMKLSEPELRNYLSKILSSYKIPKRIAFGKIPRNALGKINRAKVSAYFSNQQE